MKKLSEETLKAIHKEKHNYILFDIDKGYLLLDARQGNQVDKIHLELIEELIYRDIPMKPKSINYCSNCNKHLYNQDYIDRINFCKHCGQRIEWGE